MWEIALPNTARIDAPEWRLSIVDLQHAYGSSISTLSCRVVLVHVL